MKILIESIPTPKRSGRKIGAAAIAHPAQDGRRYLFATAPARLARDAHGRLCCGSMGTNKDDSLPDLNTVPPPDGEADAYSAATIQQSIPPEILAAAGRGAAVPLPPKVPRIEPSDRAVANLTDDEAPDAPTLIAARKDDTDPARRTPAAKPTAPTGAKAAPPTTAKATPPTAMTLPPADVRSEPPDKLSEAPPPAIAPPTALAIVLAVAIVVVVAYLIFR